MKKSEPDLPLQPTIPFVTASNGEFVPPQMTHVDHKATELYWDLVEERSRKLGWERRDFLQSTCGAATALMVMNIAYGCEGGLFKTDDESTQDPDKACSILSGDEFIFDIQTHHVNPTGAWREALPGWSAFLNRLPQAYCGEGDPIDCFNAENYLREMFIKSDTDLAVLSAVPSEPFLNPLEAEEAAETRQVIHSLSNSQRNLIHGLVLPNRGESQLDGMQALAEEFKIAAWKIYTPYGSWRLDDEAVGIPFLERARSLGIKVVCAHKGLPLSSFDPAFASPDDIGVVAKAYPDIDFIVYHSGYETEHEEGPYNSETPQGIDRLIKSLEDNELSPNSNVYAELGSTWRFVMSRPTQAAHVLGKLLKYIGQDRVVWGTDSIWYGTPQDQIMALRAFEISEEFQELYGYPALTQEIKAKIFGLNAAGPYGVDPDEIRCAITEDHLSQMRAQLTTEAIPTFRHYGPRNRREFLAFLKSRNGFPG